MYKLPSSASMDMNAFFSYGINQSRVLQCHFVALCAPIPSFFFKRFTVATAIFILFRIKIFVLSCISSFFSGIPLQRHTLPR
jgi:hypothetical protein